MFWLPCACHVVYQLRSREGTLALSAEWLIASAAPVFLHFKKTEDAVKLWVSGSAPFVIYPGWCFITELLLISAWEVMGWPDGCCFLLFLERNTSVSDSVAAALILRTLEGSHVASLLLLLACRCCGDGVCVMSLTETRGAIAPGCNQYPWPSSCSQPWVYWQRRLGVVTLHLWYWADGVYIARQYAVSET